MSSRALNIKPQKKLESWVYKKILNKIDENKNRNLRYPSGYQERMWWLVGKDISKMKDDPNKINRLYDEIERFIQNGSGVQLTKWAIDDLYVHFHLGTGILDIPRDDLESFFFNYSSFLPSEWGSEEIGKKLKSTYNYFKDNEATSDEDKLFRIKAYYNVFAVYPAGRDFIFEGVELTIFPPKPNYNYNYNKKRPFGSDGSGSGSRTKTKPRIRYGGDGSDSSTTTTTINTKTKNKVLKF